MGDLNRPAGGPGSSGKHRHRRRSDHRARESSSRCLATGVGPGSDCAWVGGAFWGTDGKYSTRLGVEESLCAKLKMY